MFDNLREEVTDPSMLQEGPAPAAKPARQIVIPERLLGMTAPQRFVISVMLLLMTSVLGTLILLVTQKVVP